MKNTTVMTRMAMAAHCLRNREVDPSDLGRIGEIQITWIGEENIYFTSLLFGSEHFCKITMIAL